MTSLSVRLVQQMAAAGRLPGAAKLGGVWTFDPDKVRAWIKGEEQHAARRAAVTAPLKRQGVTPMERMMPWQIEEAYNRAIGRKSRSRSKRQKHG